MTLPARPTLQRHTRAAWRRAADELLIDAIFGSALAVIRDDTITTAAPQSRALDLPVRSAIIQAGAVAV